MRVVTQGLLVVVVVVVVAASGFLAGWYLRPTGGGGTTTAESSTLSVIAAGSLAPILPSFVSAFANATPGVNAPVSAQLYEGSTAAATTLAGGNQPYDLFISADFRTIPKDLEPPASTVANWEVVFASDPMVLAYNPSVSALAGINTSNWASKIVQSGVTLGTPNASSDPLGYNAIFTLELEDSAANLSGSLYNHFFNGGKGALATPTSSTLFVSENTASAALSSGEVDTFLIYRSYAVADHLTSIPLSAAVNLASTDSASVAADAKATSTILSGTSTKVVSGAPVLFALTVPKTATNTALGLAFAAYLLSNQTAAAWAADGFAPLSPAWASPAGGPPPGLDGFTSAGLPPLPPYLASLT